MKVVITYRDEGKPYADLIQLAFKSANRFGYETRLIDDEDVKRPHLPLMDWILHAQLHFIKSDEFNQDTVLFSPDAIIQRPLSPVFKMGFDMAFTVRNNKRWPINNGVIFIKPEKKNLISAFWADCAIRCSKYEQHVRDWYGDQLSLHEELLAHNDKPYGLNVLRLPCSQYNANPGSGSYIAHYKGKRKDDMRCLLQG